MRSLNKKIVLIQPRTGSWDMMSLRFPESLLAIAAIPKQKGYDVTILDQRLDNNWKATLTSRFNMDLKNRIMWKRGGIFNLTDGLKNTRIG